MILINSQPILKHIKINLFNNKKSVLKIAHLPDLHLNGIWKCDINKIVKNIENSNVDLVVYNGDIFQHYGEIDTIKHIKALRSIKNSFYIIGNREGRFEYNNSFSNDLDKCKELLKNGGLTLLEELKININNQNINIVGVSDIYSDSETYYQQVAELNKQEIENSIIFCHNPTIQNDLNFNILKNNLIISGHTHAGQIFPFGYLKLDKSLRGISKKKKGLNLLKNNNQIFIGNGAGFNHINLRVFARNHIDIIEVY